jgi:energy-coupling factor transporter ATP-binding protein EcfA2
MNGEGRASNPFVGLRPFESRDSLYYFGRKLQSHALLKQLYANRFVAVIGSSGCGKSSLVRAGLIPNLEAGFLVQDRDLWKIATFKPGDEPLYNLAAAMASAAGSGETRGSVDEWLQNMQSRGGYDLAGRLRATADGDDSNLLVVVDQFEELFRFQQARTTRVREEAADFVGILLHLAEQTTAPVYIVLTMRSDFLGECDAFQGLPEAMNQSQYLVPRLTRQQRREAILGPIRLAGADITPRLMDRLLNESLDTGDDLPVLQHALMRTWDAWVRDGGMGPIDLDHYEASGTLQDALRRHADEALENLDAESLLIAKRMFQALTETDAANRRIRRPAHLSRIAAICGEGVSAEAIMRLIARFNSDNRNFLVLSARAAAGDPLVDISHESLIRQWKTLADWVDEEAESTRIYRRLAESAELYAAGKAGLYKETDLQVALDWQHQHRPTAAWAARYQADFHQVMNFLVQSVRKQKTNRHFITSLLVCLYACACSWMVITATDDVSLATNLLSLPIIGTVSPTSLIYTAAPLVLIGLQAWFLFHLQRLLQILSLQPQPQAGESPLAARLETLGLQFLAWVSVPAVLAGFWVRYLLRRDATVTGFHVLLLTLSIFLVVTCSRLSRAGVQPAAPSMSPPGKRAGAVCALLAALALCILSIGAFKGTPERHLTRHMDLRALVPWIFHQVGYNLFFDLREQHVSRLPANYWDMLDASEIRRAIRGAFLKKADLRYADMYQAFVAKANLRNSELRGARLREADFRAADLRGANLEGGDLRQGDFRDADFREAVLVGVDLRDADLKDAQLGLADLKRANFDDARLEGADLRCADLRDARELDIEGLASVKTLYRARMDPDVRERLQSVREDLFTKPPDTWHDMTTPENVGRKDICE